MQADAAVGSAREAQLTPAGSDSDAEPPNSKQSGKRLRGKNQHKIAKRSKGNQAGSFFADLL